MKKWINRAVGMLVVAAVIGAVVFAFIPRPVMVDTAAVTLGPMRVTVDEDGKTRIKEKYVVSTPLGGTLLRVDLEPGDAVEKGVTPIAVLRPLDADLLTDRSYLETKARINAAQARLEQTRPSLEAAKAELQLADSEYTRLRKLVENGSATAKEVDDAALMLRLKEEAYRSTQFSAEIAQYELDLAKAAQFSTAEVLASSEMTDAQRKEVDRLNRARQLIIPSPTTGQVLRVFQESAAVVSPGAPLVEVGDPADLEIEVDVLSSDAVRIKPGANVIIEHWGGDEPLHGSVRKVEPAAFTKVSALGVEEQRVNVIVDFNLSAGVRPRLGDGFRVEARIVIWEADEVLMVPTSALFRSEGRWAVFLIKDGKAVVKPIEVGGQTGLAAQVLSGLEAADLVIIHPSDQVKADVAVQSR